MNYEIYDYDFADFNFCCMKFGFSDSDLDPNSQLFRACKFVNYNISLCETSSNAEVVVYEYIDLH